MGLDIALGLIILLGAIRGWFRGFVLQAIRSTGVVGSVYAAGPIRDLVRPYVVTYLASIPPQMLDRMLWWTSAALSYVAMVGVANLGVKLYRRRPYGEPEPDRADQFGGFLLGAGKGIVVAAFLVSALDHFAMNLVKGVPWAAEQARTSQAVAWNEQYRPADRIWAAPPVQHFVTHVRRMGIATPSALGEPSPTIERIPVQTASRPPRLDLPVPETLDPTSADFSARLDEEIRQIDRPTRQP